MLRALVGKRVQALESDAFRALLENAATVVVDVGTGDGRYVLRAALSQDTLCIGVDPDAASMAEASLRARRKGGPEHGTLFVVAAAEDLPEELAGVADLVHVQFPWGKLLEGSARPEAWFLEAVRRLLKPGGRFELVLGYDPDSDDARVRGAGLPALDDDTMAALAAAYAAGGFGSVSSDLLTADEMAELQSSWARRLRHGPPRPVYRLQGVKA